MNRNQKADNRLTYVFTYLLKSYVETERRIQEEIQRMGLASVGDVTTNQSLISTIEKDLENLNPKDDTHGNDYFEDHFNLALSNLSQNILPINEMTSSNILTSNNNLVNGSDPQHFSFKLPEYDKENVKEDVLLKLTQHLENKVSGLLKHIKDVLELNNNQDLKVLRERNIELSNKLKEEFQRRDDAVQRLIKAEQDALKYFNQIQSYEEDLKNLDALRNQNESLKRQLKQFDADYRKLIKDKEDLEKYNLLFKNNLPDLEKKLKIDLEESRKQILMIEKERDDVIQRLNRLKAEKERQEEENNRLSKELELQQENFDNEIRASQKQLENQKKFIECQTLERESEIDEYMANLDELSKQLKEKEDKELNYLEKIRQYEDQIELISDEKQKLEKCYQETSTRLVNESKRNKQLQNLLDEYEKTKAKTEQVEKELRDRLTKLEDDLYSQLKLNETLKKNQTEQSFAIVSSFVDNVCENVEQLRCSSVNHDSNVMRNMLLDCHSNNQIQETLQNKQIDSLYNSSTIDCTFPDAKKLEEKNSKLNSLIENVVRENQDLNDELKGVKTLNQDLESKIRRLEPQIDGLKKDLEKMLLEKRVLQANIDEKESKMNELQIQLEDKMNDHNDSKLKQSIESLKKKLFDEEQKVKKLNEDLKKTNSKLTEKQNQIYRISGEIDQLKNEKHKIEEERLALQQRNKKLHNERNRLQQEIEDLQNEREDEFEDNCEIKKMFEIVLLDKDEEIANLNGHLDVISQKLIDCLSISPVDARCMNYFTLLDELISSYQKSVQLNQFNSKKNQLKNDPTRSNRLRDNKLESESYDSLSPIESCEDQMTSDELNGDDYDDEICNKLAGIHNNSLEICNLSFHFKNEKGLIKLINEIPEIVTNERLHKREINEWQTNFIDCFTNKIIAQLLAKNIITLRPMYLSGSPSKSNNTNDLEKQELVKQLEMYKSRLKNESMQLRRCNANRKALIFQKKYLMNLNKQFNHQSFKHRALKKFKIVSLAIIALNKMKKMKRQRDTNDNQNQTELVNKIDQLTIQLTDVLNPTAEKYSSFINSLRPSSSNKVPFNNHQSNNVHQLVNCQLKNHQNIHPIKNHLADKSHQLLHNEQNRAATIKSLKDLLDSLKEVYERLAFDDTLLTVSSSHSSLSNI